MSEMVCHRIRPRFDQQAFASAVTIPVIACSGVGRYEDYAKGVKAGASAVAAANIWHFKESADRGGKRALAKAGVHVRIEEQRIAN